MENKKIDFEYIENLCKELKTTLEQQQINLQIIQEECIDIEDQINALQNLLELKSLFEDQ